MITRKNILDWVGRLVEQFSPERVILFGSYADGNPGTDSDIDLLVVLPHSGSAVEKASEMRLAMPLDIPFDIIVRAPQTLRKRVAMNDYFIRDILRKGLVLYASGDDRVG